MKNTLETDTLLTSSHVKTSWPRSVWVLFGLMVMATCAIVIAVTVSRPQATENPSDCDHVVVGAGFGGVYAAWRIAHVQPSARVCLFEKLGRIGGKAWDVTGDDFPELGFQMAEMASDNFPSSNYVLRHLVVEHLKLPIKCFFTDRDIEPDDPDCPANTPVDYWARFMRGRAVLAPQFNSSQWFPYDFAPDEQWGEGTEREAPYSVLASPLQFLSEIAPWLGQLASPVSEVRATAATAAIHHLRGVSHEGRHLNQLNMYDVSMELTGEFLEYFDDSIPSFTQNVPFTSVLAFLESFVKGMAVNGPSNISATYALADHLPFSHIISELLRESISAGAVQLYLHSEVQRVHSDADGGLSVDVLDGITGDLTTYRAHSAVLLDSDYRATIALLTRSETVDVGIPTGTRELMNHGILRAPLLRVYLHYPDVWWKEFVGTHAISSYHLPGWIRYHQGDIECPDDREAGTCGGLLAAAYFGSLDSRALNILNVLPSDIMDGGVAQLVPSNVGHARVLSTLHADLVDMHGDVAPNVSLSEPSFGLVSFFPHALPVALPNAGHFPDFDQTIVNKPNPRVPAFLINAAFSRGGGSAEGAIQMTETALQALGVPRPSFMDEAQYSVYTATFMT